MNFLRIILSFIVLISSVIFAAEPADTHKTPASTESKVGSWVFSGVATNESGERFGYFFQMQRQGASFYTKSAVIDGQNNSLLFFYEDKEKIDNFNDMNWQVGRSFMRHNPINDSWIFGVKVEDNKGFNFKVDMLKKDSSEKSVELKPGIHLEAQETTRLNGHIQLGADSKEQFVTSNKAWFAKIKFSQAQKTGGAINTTFCRLNNDNGFYAANLKEPHLNGKKVTSWRDASGSEVKMSKSITIKSLANNECLLHVSLPNLTMKLSNTLKNEGQITPAVAGFSKQNPMGFCFVEEQSFLPLG